jgi:hypothetical protein
VVAFEDPEVVESWDVVELHLCSLDSAGLASRSVIFKDCRKGFADFQF